MKVKVGDTVRVIAGKDKGKEGKILKTFKSENRVVVEGLNMIKKHSKPRTAEDKGGIIEIEAPIHVSNVKVITKNEKEAKKEVAKKETKTTEKKTTTKKAATKKESK